MRKRPLVAIRSLVYVVAQVVYGITFSSIALADPEIIMTNHDPEIITTNQGDVTIVDRGFGHGAWGQVLFKNQVVWSSRDFKAYLPDDEEPRKQPVFEINTNGSITTLVLIVISRGGNGCPSKNILLVINGSRTSVTKAFGNCFDGGGTGVLFPDHLNINFLWGGRNAKLDQVWTYDRKGLHCTYHRMNQCILEDTP